ncbi:hypothetical protein ABT033_31295 [Streptomyces pharetrae]|uniref:hypothetical protein n=1 Tax=Streptomyces pharetrae TaxID=291370 RepID=UPI00335CC659
MKTQSPSPLDDRRACLIVSVAVGALVLALVALFAYLTDDSRDDSRGGSSRSCPAPAVTVDPVTCLPYGPGAPAAPGTNHSGSSARQPAQQPKAPAPMPPAAKAPAAPAVKVPAAPPLRIK